ncbi:MAG: tRNA (adenosine(37)-N6)-threonylcarbamoyltransferase complex ATPase subunit type 1 TsaE [Pseudomonadota bacterium]
MSFEAAIESEDAMVAFGSRLADAMEPGSVVFLRGELGAGKTTLSRGLARGLGHDGAVKSPTYTLVEPYEHLNPTLYHFDLYRLGDAEELEFMGLRDYVNGESIVLIEWPERGGAFLPAPDLELTIAVTADGRRITAEASTNAGRACLTRLEAS